MINYNELITKVSKYIKSKHKFESELDEFCIDIGKQVTQKMISKTERKMGVNIPEQLAKFYLQVGDGIEFYWYIQNVKSSENYSKHFVCGHLEIPSLKRLKKGLSYWKKLPWRIFSPLGSILRYYKDLPSDSSEKKKFFPTLERAERCIPLWDIGNGDIVCIDNDATNNPIVYLDHETIEFYIMGASFEKFFSEWAELSFQKPTEWHFNGNNGGTNWMTNHFYKPFIRSTHKN